MSSDLTFETSWEGKCNWCKKWIVIHYDKKPICARCKKKLIVTGLYYKKPMDPRTHKKKLARRRIR